MKPDKTFTLEKADLEKMIGQPVSEFSTKSGSNTGDNVAGDLISINITTATGEKLQLVYKGFPSEGDPEQRQYVVQFGIFRTETCMYEKLLPRIQELVEKKQAKSDAKLNHLKLPIVKYISGFNDDKSDYVILEDCRPQGFKMQNKYQSLTLAEVTLVMHEIAKFHALSYYLVRYEGERLFEEDERISRIKYNAMTLENPMLSEMFSRMFKSYFENVIELLEPRDKELAEHVRRFDAKSDHNRFMQFQKHNRMKTDKTMFACIVHGDLWTNNILFKYTQDGKRDTPSELKFIDFQLSRRGNIYEDLGYFFWTSTTPAFRKLHLITMLNEYYVTFETTLNQIDFPMPVGFTKGSFIDGFYDGVLANFCFMPFALGLQMGDLTVTQEDVMKENGIPVEASKNTPGKKNGEEATKNENGEAPQPPAFDMTAIIEGGKKMHMLRMKRSPKALERLEELTREIVEMKLLE